MKKLLLLTLLFCISSNVFAINCIVYHQNKPQDRRSSITAYNIGTEEEFDMSSMTIIKSRTHYYSYFDIKKYLANVKNEQDRIEKVKDLAGSTYVSLVYKPKDLVVEVEIGQFFIKANNVLDFKKQIVSVVNEEVSDYYLIEPQSGVGIYCQKM